MSKRSGSKSGSARPGGAGLKLLKFSNTSISSARASYARQEQQQSPDDSQNNSEDFTRRHKFFDDSTGLGYVFVRIVTYVCRQVTTIDYIYHRLAIYSGLVIVGGILNEFVSSLLRVLRVSSQSSINRILVRAGWGIHCFLLFGLVLLSSRSAIVADQVHLDEIEQSFEQYFERKRSGLQQAQQVRRRPSASATTTYSTLSSGPSGQMGSGSSANTIVSLQDLAQMENAQQQFENDLIKCSIQSDNSHHQQQWLSWLRQFWVRDLWRLVACNLIYLLSMALFFNIRSITKQPGTGAGPGKPSRTSTPGRVTAVQPLSNSGPTGTDDLSSMVDISGHMFLLIFSNLIFFEECCVLAGWEQMAERLSELYKEYVKIGVQETSATFGPLMSCSSGTSWLASMPSAWRNNGRALCRAQLACTRDRSLLRLCFLLGTLYSVCRDLMIFQTAFFYHTIFEKIAALLWAILCWYVAYRVLFPWIGMGVKPSSGSRKSSGPSFNNNNNNPSSSSSSSGGSTGTGQQGNSQNVGRTRS